ncbi:MAG: tryptophan 2,3-dioxygenase [Actinomycetota bacterium]|nr:tryptophan 2,3-dioxygenase [Actinomycetota bacterium]MDQ3647881.1 tryptophan 2,3-dioxygenase [Actinomycetota bacterium]
MNANHEIASSELTAWRECAHPGAFPYDAVIAAIHGVGKHFVASELLEDLDRVRRDLPRGCPAHRQLAQFLDTALDKFDGRYDNPSYLALEQLGLPGADGCPDPGHAAQRRDRLIALLLADVLRFELATARGCIDLMPELRPDARVTAKRCRHALRAILPALERLGIDVEVDSNDPMGTAHRVCRAVLSSATPAERRTLQLTAIPVSLVHDEYMFIRALQSYETIFAQIGVQLTTAIAALTGGDAALAAEAIRSAETTVRESSPLWSLVATMQAEAFLRFREYTEGASAIQSRSYKRLESLCRRPDPERLDSPAYHSVPEVRERVIAGQPNLDQALDTAIASGLLTPDEHTALSAAMDAFETAILKWRKTHHSIAVRMLGERRGTGDTEGVAYLEQARTIPLFASGCPFGHGAPGADSESSEVLHHSRA